jgi:hypothetical protein
MSTSTPQDPPMRAEESTAAGGRVARSIWMPMQAVASLARMSKQERAYQRVSRSCPVGSAATSAATCAAPDDDCDEELRVARCFFSSRNFRGNG